VGFERHEAARRKGVKVVWRRTGRIKDLKLVTMGMVGRAGMRDSRLMDRKVKTISVILDFDVEAVMSCTRDFVRSSRTAYRLLREVWSTTLRLPCKPPRQHEKGRPAHMSQGSIPCELKQFDPTRGPLLFSSDDASTSMDFDPLIADPKTQPYASHSCYSCIVFSRDKSKKFNGRRKRKTGRATR
jgi:hypothetical protein